MGDKWPSTTGSSKKPPKILYSANLLEGSMKFFNIILFAITYLPTYLPDLTRNKKNVLFRQWYHHLSPILLDPGENQPFQDSNCQGASQIQISSDV